MRLQRVLRLAAALVGVVAGAVSARLALSAPWYTVGDTAARGAVLGLTAGAALLGAGLCRSRSDQAQMAGWLLTAAGTAWLVTAWDDPHALAWVFVIGRIFGTVWPVLLAHGLLAMFGPLNRTERTLLAAAYTVTTGAGLAVTLLFNPATNGCAACPVNPILILDAPAVAAWLEHAATLAGPVWASLLTVALTFRLIRSTPPKRRLMLPTDACGIAVLAFVAVVYLRAIAGGHAETAGAAVSTESVLLILLCLSTGWPAFSLALTRHRLGRLVVQASAVQPVGGLGPVLKTVLGDPTARLLYPRDGSAGQDLIDAEGEPARPQATLTPLTRGITTVGYLDHQAELLQHDIAVFAQVARLSIDNERLHAERAAQLRELRASRVRIVAAADRERRRLERDLHDGAQQRLVSLALGIRLEGMTLANSTGSDRDLILADAEAEVADALAELRTIARGLYPRELADEGLEAALETFVETDPTPVRLDLHLAQRAPPEVESAAFFAVAQVLATSTYTPTPGRAVRVRRSGGHLELALHGGTRIDELTTVEDRVGAIGGTVQRLGAGAIRIELPCVS